MFLSRTKIPAIRLLPLCLVLAIVVGLLGALPVAAGEGRINQTGDPTPYPRDDSPTPNYRPYVPGELVVKLGPDSTSIDSINGIYGTTVKMYFEQLNIYILSTDPDVDIDNLVDRLNNTPGVVFAQPNYIVSPLQSVQGSIPFSDQDNIGSYPDQDAAVRLRLETAHNYSTGAGVKVAVIDGGVNFGHPQLAGATVSGWDFVDDDSDAFDEPGGSNSGHGTFVAGVIHLVAPGAQIVSYRVADTSGQSDGDLVAEAIIRAIADGCKVINLSLVMTHEHEVLRDALAYARSRNVMVVTAAGNGATDVPAYPASDPNVLAVAAVDTLDRLADFSRYGLNIDLCAPGARIYAPYEDIFAWWSGTSFAAPFVAGTAALKIAQNGVMIWPELHAYLTGTADNIDADNPAYIGLLGAGLIDPVAVLQDSVGIDTAWTNPPAVFVMLQPGQSAQKCVTLGSTNASSVFSAYVLSGGAGVVTLQDTVANYGANFCFDVSAAGLAEGIYVDTVLFDVSGVSNSPLLVPVTLAVSDTGAATYSAAIWPAQISVGAEAGSSTPVNFCSYLTSTNAPAAFTVSPFDSMSSFIEVLNPSGLTDDTVCVRIDPTGLAPGVYYDSLFYRVNNVPNSVVQPVVLTVGSPGGTDTATVWPSMFSFDVPQNGGSQSACAFLTSTNAPAPYSLEVVGNAGWLHLTDSIGTTDDSVCFTVDPIYTFAAGTFIDTILCHVDGVASDPHIVVELNVGGDTTGGATATVTPSYFDFVTGPAAGAPIQAGTFVLNSSNAPASFTVHTALGSGWLRPVDTAGVTADSVRFTVDATGLTAGTYYDSLICVVQGVTYSPGAAVSLTVVTDTGGTQATASLSPAQLSFATGPQAGAPIQTGSFVLSSTNAPASYTAASVLGSSWLHVVDSVGTTNDSVRITVDATGLPTGTYVDSVVCQVAGVANPPVGIVMLNVYSGADTVLTDTAAAYPSTFQFAVPQGSPALQHGCFTLWSTNAPAGFTLQKTLNSPWIQLGTTSGMTGDSVCFSVDPTGLQPGVYSDAIFCYVDGTVNVPAVPVVLEVTQDSSGSGETASVAPSSYTFTVVGSDLSPRYGGFMLSSTNAPANYVAEVLGGAGWLRLVDSVGATNDSVAFIVDPAAPFSAGTYIDSIAFYVDGVGNVPIGIVILNLQYDTTGGGGGGGATAGVSPDFVNLNAAAGSTTILPVCVAVSSSNAPADYVAWVPGLGGSFITIPDSLGVTDDSLCFDVDPSGLAAGTYYDTVLIQVNGVTAPLPVTVGLTVGSGQVSTISNYPNPFNPSTTIEYSLPERARVTIDIYNVLGRKVRSLVDAEQAAGSYRIEWNGTDENGRSVASGVYLYRFQAGDAVQTKKMLLAK